MDKIRLKVLKLLTGADVRDKAKAGLIRSKKARSRNRGMDVVPETIRKSITLNLIVFCSGIIIIPFMAVLNLLFKGDFEIAGILMFSPLLVAVAAFPLIKLIGSVKEQAVSKCLTSVLLWLFTLSMLPLIFAVKGIFGQVICLAGLGFYLERIDGLTHKNKDGRSNMSFPGRSFPVKIWDYFAIGFLILTPLISLDNALDTGFFDARVNEYLVSGPKILTYGLKSDSLIGSVHSFLSSENQLIGWFHVGFYAISSGVVLMGLFKHHKFSAFLENA